MFEVKVEVQRGRVRSGRESAIISPGQRHTDRQLPSVRFFYAVELARPEDVIPDFIPGEADACLCNACFKIATVITIENLNFLDIRTRRIPKQQPRVLISHGFFGCVAKTGVDGKVMAFGAYLTGLRRAHRCKYRLNAVANFVENSDLSQIQDRKVFLRGVF